MHSFHCCSFGIELARFDGGELLADAAGRFRFASKLEIITARQNATLYFASASRLQQGKRGLFSPFFPGP